MFKVCVLSVSSESYHKSRFDKTYTCKESCMSALVLLKKLNELGKRDKISSIIQEHES